MTGRGRHGGSLHGHHERFVVFHQCFTYQKPKPDAPIPTPPEAPPQTTAPLKDPKRGKPPPSFFLPW